MKLVRAESSSTAARRSSTSRPTAGSTSGSWSRTSPTNFARASRCARSGCATRRAGRRVGPCGKDLCCATFLRDFEPITVKMAKDQKSSLETRRSSPGSAGG